MRKALRKTLPILLLILIAGGITAKLTVFESGKPWIEIAGGEALGPELKIKAGDAKSGLAAVRVEAVQGDKTAVLWAEPIAAGTRELEKAIALRPLPAGLADGPILIRVTAEDRSWNGGNVTVAEKKAVVDTKPPRLTVMGGPHYVNQGGVGCITYTSDEVPAASGLSVGGVEFRGYPLEGNRLVVFYALGHGVPAEVSFPGLRRRRGRQQDQPGLPAEHKEESLQAR